MSRFVSALNLSGIALRILYPFVSMLYMQSRIVDPILFDWPISIVLFFAPVSLHFGWTGPRQPASLVHINGMAWHGGHGRRQRRVLENRRLVSDIFPL
jgi:hypothetical protein